MVDRSTGLGIGAAGWGIPAEFDRGARVTLYTSTRRLGDVIVVDCRGKIVFGEEATSLRLLVKDLLKKS